MGSAEDLHLATQSGDLLSASKSTSYAIAAAKSRGYWSTEILWERKELQAFMQSSEIFFSGEQGEGPVLLVCLPPHYRWGLCVPCIAVTAVCVRAWLLRYLVFKWYP